MHNFYLATAATTVPLTKVVVSFGLALGPLTRSTNADVNVAAPGVLPQHCSLVVCNALFERVLVNLSPTAPPLVNNQPVPLKAPLHPGDIIDIGGARFTYLSRIAPAAVAQQPDDVLLDDSETIVDLRHSLAHSTVISLIAPPQPLAGSVVRPEESFDDVLFYNDDTQINLQ